MDLHKDVSIDRIIGLIDQNHLKSPQNCWKTSMALSTCQQYPPIVNLQEEISL